MSEPPAWTELAAQQLVRYQALFTLLDEIQAVDDIAAIAARVATRWKYIANVSSWRLIIAKNEGFLIIDASRGEARVSEARTLSPWDGHYWNLKRPALISPAAGTAHTPPDHLKGSEPAAEITVAPFFRMGCHIGLLSAAALRPPLTDLDHKFIRLLGAYFADRISGILLQRQAMDILMAKATIDPLTGLPNRGAILDRLGSQLALSKRTRQPLSVILLDIDFFKTINDTYGHPAGDQVLREVSHRLQVQMRQGDSVGRYGGEEFLVVLYPCGGDEVAGIAERLRSTIAELPFQLGADAHMAQTVTISLGASTSPPCSDITLDGLIKKADEALYRSKSGGRNRVTVGGECGRRRI